MAAFDLRENPFFVLGVSARSDAAAISRAADEAIASGRLDAAAVRGAAATLTDPESRLAAEIGWLPGVPEEYVAALRSLLLGGIGSYDTGGPAAMAMANLYAHLCEADDDEESFGDLFIAHAKIDIDDLMRTVNADRSAAGVPPADRGQIVRALAAIRDAHVEGALTAIRAAPKPRPLAIAIIRHAAYHPDVSDDFFERFVDRYLADAEPRLARAEASVRKALAAFERSESLDAGGVAGALRGWRREIEPRFIVSFGNRGEEPRTAALCADVLAAAKAMAARGAYDKADALHRALGMVFSGFAAVLDRIARNMRESLAAAGEKGDASGALIAALQEATSDFDGVTATLRVTGFGRSSAGWPGRLYAGFAAAAAGLAGTPRAALPWTLMLNLFDRLRQGPHYEETSRIVLDALVGFVEAPIPAEIADRLTRELEAAKERDFVERLRRMASDGRPKEVRRLLRQAEAELHEKETLRKVRRVGRISLMRARGARRQNRGLIWTKRLVYVVAAIVVLTLLWRLARRLFAL
jgi:hypothetical protein